MVRWVSTYIRTICTFRRVKYLSNVPANTFPKCQQRFSRGSKIETATWDCLTTGIPPVTRALSFTFSPSDLHICIQTSVAVNGYPMLSTISLHTVLCTLNGAVCSTILTPYSTLGTVPPTPNQFTDSPPLVTFPSFLPLAYFLKSNLFEDWQQDDTDSLRPTWYFASFICPLKSYVASSWGFVVEIVYLHNEHCSCRIESEILANFLDATACMLGWHFMLREWVYWVMGFAVGVVGEWEGGFG